MLVGARTDDLSRLAVGLDPSGGRSVVAVELPKLERPVAPLNVRASRTAVRPDTRKRGGTEISWLVRTSSSVPQSATDCDVAPAVRESMHLNAGAA